MANAKEKVGEWMKKERNKSLEELLAESRLSLAYKDIGDDKIKRRICGRYEELLRDITPEREILASHLVDSILPAAAFYEILS